MSFDVVLNMIKDVGESSFWGMTKIATFRAVCFVGVVLVAAYMKRLFTAKMNMLSVPSPLFPVAALIKCVSKQQIFPEKADRKLFVAAPIAALFCFLFLFLLVPFSGDPSASVPVGALYTIFILYAGICAFVTGGFSCGSRFAFLGAVRALMRLLSVQPILFLIVCVVLMSADATRLSGIVAAQQGLWFVFPHFPMAVLFVACTLFLLNNFRFEAPFAQKELMSGVYGGYASGLYLFLLWSDYALMVFMALLGTFLFLGGSLAPFGWNFLSPSVWLVIKTTVAFLIFVLAENALPDYRSDRLLTIAFKRFLPLTVLWLAATAAFCLMRAGDIV